MNYMDNEDDFDTFQVSSATDYTGLMPTPPLTEAEWENYQDLYATEMVDVADEPEQDY